MTKLFASDFDGTLFMHRRKPPIAQETADAVRKFQDEGNLFGLCTGRPLWLLVPFTEGIIRPDFYIACSGAEIYDANLRALYIAEIERTCGDAVLRYAETCGVPATFVISGRMMRCSRDIFAGLDYYRYTAEAPEGTLTQISLHCRTAEDAASVTAEINRLFPVLQAFQNVRDIDIVAKGCSKGSGIAFLRNLYPGARVYGIGDSLNDLPLLQAADKAYTFTNAPQALRDEADRTVDEICEALADSLRDS